MPKYGKKAQQLVETAVKKFKKGKLVSGRTGKPVKNLRQAVAIGLSEARKLGAKMPAYRRRK